MRFFANFVKSQQRQLALPLIRELRLWSFVKDPGWGKAAWVGGGFPLKWSAQLIAGRVRNGMEDTKKRVLRENEDPALFLCCFPFLVLFPLAGFCCGYSLGLPGLLFFL